MNYAYAYVLDTMADWELGFVTAELNSGQYFKRRGSRIPVKTVGASKRPITTKGGMKILPDLTVDEISHETSAILLLPGADSWNDPEHAPVVEKAKQLLKASGNVAAICGATTALANAGLLDDRQHTSNSLEYLTMFCPAYKGAAFYKEKKIVADGNLITTGSAGGLLLAREVIALLDLFKKDTLEAWYNYFNTGDGNYFAAMMETLQESNSTEKK
ncbi:DJ-1/PfpI family protein [Paenibacillus nasutitermitis]|uniref:Glutamine amidotransferase n=1 Tax=Paenibacillus nasutitermitis TaxID=1652958 RepID=A0A917DP75_9BACL|nr:DJ-1/PfpI family protein [Paenibacillus nasutitermitis]GGD53451.1 glutamine amidotransferase [Paenibacillus nasutitermitis]